MTTMDGLTPELELERQRYLRQQKIAEALTGQGRQTITGRMVGNRYVAPSPFEGLANMLDAASGAKYAADADRGMQGLTKKYNEGLASAVQDYTTARNAPAVQSEPAVDEAVGLPPTPPKFNDPRDAITKAIVSQYPQLRSLAQMDLQNLNRKEDREDTQRFRADQAAEQRGQRMHELEMRLADARTNAKDRADLQRELAQMRVDAQRDMARLTAGLRQPPAPVAVMGPDGKPVYVNPDQAVGRQPAGKSAAQLPGSALKLQQEELDAINIAASINADMGALKTQIDGGKLKIGPVQNLKSQAKNAIGMSDENSRNFASFRATLEKLRNDSLRLNKGVQTEGDAQRAWNEMINNINDPKVVSQRLEEIQKINERAINLRRNNVNLIRSNYGVDPLAESPAPPAAVGGAGAGQPAGGATGGWAVVN